MKTRGVVRVIAGIAVAAVVFTQTPLPQSVRAAAPEVVPIGQTIGGAGYGVNPTSVDSDVNSLDGALEVSHTDIRVAGIGVPLVIDREYNSQNAGITGAFGPGWSSMLDLAVRFENGGSRAIVYGEDGQQVGFTYVSANKTWTPDPGVRTILSCSGPATNNAAPTSCIVTRFADGVNWTLNQGRVQDYQTAAHQGLKFGYTQGRITSVTVESTASKPLIIHLTRNAAGLVTKLTTPKRSVSYAYDASGDLSAVTDPNGNVWKMTYAAGHLLTAEAAYPMASSSQGISILTAAYDSGTGRVSAAVERLGSTMHDTTFGWTGTGETGKASRNELVAVNGGPLQRITYTDTYTNGMIVKKQDPSFYATTYSYDANLDLTATTNPLGAMQTMTYDAAGDELSTSTNLDNSGHVESQTFTYDSHHRLTSIVQPVTAYLTDTTSFAYNSKGELASTASSGAGTSTYTYNSLALRTSQKSSQGNVTTHTYDAYGNMTGESVKSKSGATPEGRGPLFVYNEAGQQVVSVLPLGNLGGGKYNMAHATRTTYSPDGQELSTTSADGAKSTTAYDAAGNIVLSTDPNGRKTMFSWAPVSVTGGQDWQETTTNPAGTTVDRYDPGGDVLSSTPPQPSTTMSGQPAGVVTDVYNSDDQLSTSTNGQGIQTSYTHDGLGDVIYSTTRDVTTAATYNLVGWATGALTTTYSYPPDEGTPGSAIPNTTSLLTLYGLAGQVEAVNDSAGGAIGYFYGPGDRVITVQDRNGNTMYSYNNLGGVTKLTSPAGKITSYTYDALGRETSRTIGSDTWKMTYNADGNLIKTVDPSGRTATYAFDAMNRKTGVTYSWASGTSGLDSPAASWTYDKLGQRMKMVDGVGTTSYAYGAQGRLNSADTAVTAGGNANFSYDYSKPGQMTVTDPDQAAVTYQTDDGGNLMGVSVPPGDGAGAFNTGNMMPTTAITGGSTSSASQGSTDGASSPNTPAGTLYPDGLLDYTFNQPYTTPAQNSTLISGTAFYSAATANGTSSANPEPPQGDFVAEADLNGNLLKSQWQTLPAAGANTGTQMTMQFGYDLGAVDTPVNETSSGGGDAGGVQLTSWKSNYYVTQQNQDAEGGAYVFNGDGNPTTIDDGGITGNNFHWNLSYDSMGEIAALSTNAPDPSNTPGTAPAVAYDQAGNMTQPGSVEPPGSTLEQPGVAWTLAYNDAGQLAQAAKQGTGIVVTYSYDGDGNLVSELTSQSGAPQRNISLTWDARPASPQLVGATITDFGDSSTIQQRYYWGNGALGMEQGGSNYVFHDDQNGTPTMVTNTSGQTVATNFYDPDGNFLDGTNTTGATLLIGFDGSYSDPVTGLDLMGARWYDPDLGTFLSRSTPASPTPGSSVALSQSSSGAIGMSTSPGVSPVMPEPGPPTGYGFAAQDPTNESEMTGTAVTPASTDTSYQGSSSSGVYAAFQTASPYAFGTLAATVVKAPGKVLLKSLKSFFNTQTPAAAEQSAGGTEVSGEGTTTGEEDIEVTSEADQVEGETAAAADDLAPETESLKAPGIGDVLTVGAMAYAAYSTAKICGEYGSSSRQCIGQALGTSLAFAAQIGCEVVTDGAGTAACGVLQSVIYTVVPLVINGDGQSFLNSVTVSSGFDIQNANVLAAQLLIAYSLGPIGATLLLGEVIYANNAAIASGFVAAGNGIQVGLTTAGEAFASGLETGFNASLSGISTAGAYFASGLSLLVTALDTIGLTSIANTVASLTTDQINNVVDQIGSALCDVVQDVSCLFSSVFSFTRSASAFEPVGVVYGSGGPTRAIRRS